MQVCIQNLNADNDLIQNEISHLKQQLNELQLKTAKDQQIVQALLSDLLNQLDFMEKHAEDIVKNYEVSF